MNSYTCIVKTNVLYAMQSTTSGTISGSFKAIPGSQADANKGLQRREAACVSLHPMCVLYYSPRSLGHYGEKKNFMPPPPGLARAFQMSPATLQVCVSGQAPVGGDRPEAIECGSERTEQESAPACYRNRTPIPPTIPRPEPIGLESSRVIRTFADGTVA